LLLSLICAACDSATEPQLNQLTLTIAGSGTGEVTFNVTGASGSTCAATTSVSCIAHYSNSELLTLSAVADEGSDFAGWSGPCSGTNACVIAMSAARNITATFNLE
jgi:hypothetical protein